MKKSFCIVYFGDIYDVNGVNFVTNFFVQAKELFSNNSFFLNKIYSRNGVLDISHTSSLPIGKNVNTNRYVIVRLIRTILSKVISSKLSYNAWYKVKNSYVNPAEKVISNNILHLNQEDIIFFQDIFTAFYFLTNAERNRNVKTVLLLHCSKEPFEQLLSYYPSLKSSHYFNILENIKKTVYNEIDQVVFLSKKTFEYNNFIQTKSRYIYNGIRDIDHTFYNKKKNFNLICLGSLTGHKGQELIIEALSLIPKYILQFIKFHIIGGGPQENYLKVLVDKKGLSNNVIFYGIRNDVSELLREMDMMVLPSKSEGMPISIIEGMRQGMFILATDVGAICEMITSDYGKIIKRDPEDIKNKILEVYNLPNEDYKIKSRQMFLKKFTLQKMAENYSKLFKEFFYEH